MILRIGSYLDIKLFHLLNMKLKRDLIVIAILFLTMGIIGSINDGKNGLAFALILIVGFLSYLLNKFKVSEKEKAELIKNKENWDRKVDTIKKRTEPITDILRILFTIVCCIYLGYKYISMPFEIKDKCKNFYIKNELPEHRYEYSYGRIFNNKYSCLIKVIPNDLDKNSYSLDVTIEGSKEIVNYHEKDRSQKYYENSTSMFNPLYLFELKK